MSISLTYESTRKVTEAELEKILEITEKANDSYDWWCEPVWVGDDLEESGKAMGSTKLFCNIEDDSTDHYMAYLDTCQIISILATVAKKLKIDWELEIEGQPFGIVNAQGPSPEVQENLATFLEMFEGDLEPLRARSREDILAQWADR